MSGIQNVIQKSMEEIQASKELKQNTLQISGRTAKKTGEKTLL